MSCKKNAKANFLTNEGVSGVIVEFIKTTLPMQLHDLIQTDREDCFFTLE